MKIFKYAGNPYLFISLYLLLIIEGEHFGGFYFLYVLLALPHGGSYAIVSVAGILFLISGYHLTSVLLRRVLVPVGFLVMIIGLLLFFYPGTEAETFHLTLPLVTFILCGLSGFSLLVNYFYGYIEREPAASS